MPVQSVNKSNTNSERWRKIPEKLGFNYSNWNHMSLIRLNFFAMIIASISWVFLVIAIILFIEAGYIKKNLINESADKLLSSSYSVENGFAIFFILVFIAAWIALLIMSWQMINKAKDIDVLEKNWWWSIFDFFLPWIFIYVSFFLWKNTFDEAVNIKNTNSETKKIYEEELREETEANINFYRNKKEEIMKREQASYKNNKKKKK